MSVPSVKLCANSASAKSCRPAMLLSWLGLSRTCFGPTGSTRHETASLRRVRRFRYRPRPRQPSAHITALWERLRREDERCYCSRSSVGGRASTVDQPEGDARLGLYLFLLFPLPRPFNRCFHGS